MRLDRIANTLAGYVGLEIRPSGFRADFEPEAATIIRRVQRYTMTTPEGVYALIQAVRYVLSRGLPGSIVECGVWRGGSMMAVALTLLQQQRDDIDLYLFDTYEGMSPPSEADVSFRGARAVEALQSKKRRKSDWLWAYAPLDEVKNTLASTGYPQSRIHFVKGRVEDTVPQHAPDQICLLRLDTDWYESTRHELVHLYPRLVSGGVLILDDYGYWRGARRAVDEYMRENGLNLLLNRVDMSVRIALKP